MKGITKDGLCGFTVSRKERAWPRGMADTWSQPEHPCGSTDEGEEAFNMGGEAWW